MDSVDRPVLVVYLGAGTKQLTRNELGGERFVLALV